MIDLEFSLALHNRTGKYFLGRDLIAAHAQVVNEVRYWRLTSPQPPSGLAAKLVGRALAIELSLRTRPSLYNRVVPRMRPTCPVLHLDPFTVPLYRTRPSDVVLWHDMGPISHSELFAPGVTSLYRAVFEMVERSGPHVVFVSRATEAAFHRNFSGELASSRVIYPAIRGDMGRSRNARPIGALTRPYLLTVGNLGARKNQLRCIEAFARTGLAEQGFEYVICGGREPGYEDVADAAGRTAGVRLLGYVPDAELAWLYRQARGFVLCSLLEGFGLPVAEAIAQGQVPLVSRDTVLEEVAGDAAFLADPTNREEIASAMGRLARLSEEERANRLARLQQDSRRFTAEQNREAWANLFAAIEPRAPAASGNSTAGSCDLQTSSGNVAP